MVESFSLGCINRALDHKPLAEIITSILNCFPRFISRINLRMKDMGLGYQNTEKIVHMSRKTLEAHLVTHEAVYVDEQKSPTALSHRL